MEEDIISKEKQLVGSELIPFDIQNEEFSLLMNVYQKAIDQVLNDLNLIKIALANFAGYDVITQISNRIKTPQSIVNKMRKNNYELTYNNLIHKINDIAGIRIVCGFQNDIDLMKRVIRNMQNVKVLKEKDYLKHPKKSGYSAYHMIIEVLVEFQGQKLLVKVEIQIRSMTMDFWSTAEHKIRYKSDHKLSALDSKKLTWYAKLLNVLDNKIRKLYEKSF